jgi:5,10-methylenetetrahydromethanopterin reductase
MEISCAFATGLDTPDHIELAEELGFSRAWCYDSPALYPDVWMVLALAAKRTQRISLGTGVLVPHLRHVMTTAAAIGTLEALAPGRVRIAVGAGNTARRAMGQKPLSWKDVRSYLETLRALLRDEETEWDGAVVRMLHMDRFSAARPIQVPIYVAGVGPRGLAVARDLADGLVVTSIPGPELKEFENITAILTGTVLDDGESIESERVLEAAGHTAAIRYHGGYERGMLESMSGGPEYKKALDEIPEGRRHLAVHEGHLFALNPIDRRFVTSERLKAAGTVLTVAEWQKRLDDCRTAGVTDLMYQPGGPDIERELRAFAAMAGLQGS